MRTVLHPRSWYLKLVIGGYYFGSVDQERYSIQRHARKINGRVFGKHTANENLVLLYSSFIAINYRLAPQYPFPCAIQDTLAACEHHELALRSHGLTSREIYT